MMICFAAKFYVYSPVPHTCLEKLFELLTWNVSTVQNKAEHLAKKWYDSSVMSSEMD